MCGREAWAREALGRANDLKFRQRLPPLQLEAHVLLSRLLKLLVNEAYRQDV